VSVYDYSYGVGLLKVALRSERYYKGIQEDSQLHVKLSGNWETLVGDQETFLHILEYENYAGYDKTVQLVKSSEVCSSLFRPGAVIAHNGNWKLPCSIMRTTRPCCRS
jgi:hypothetical protein